MFLERKTSQIQVLCSIFSFQTKVYKFFGYKSLIILPFNKLLRSKVMCRLSLKRFSSDHIQTFDNACGHGHNFLVERLIASQIAVGTPDVLSLQYSK